MAITIDRDQRDGMYQEVLLDLHGLTDLWTEFDAGNYGLGRAASNAKVAARSGHSRRSR